jgi:hypothetical protein
VQKQSMKITEIVIINLAEFVKSLLCKAPKPWTIIWRTNGITEPELVLDISGRSKV